MQYFVYYPRAQILPDSPSFPLATNTPCGKIPARMLRVLLISLVLFVGTFSKVPTSACHCHEKKRAAPVAPTTQVCPFSELRQLAGGLMDVAVAFNLLPQESEFLPVTFAPRLMYFFDLLDIERDRAPPSAL